ncbi:MAG: hypothetical protein DRO67_10075 [Candidatus Asgardarchaeum californiense]|nr:MAG: hypothetical protein DRO67_10075 [Candidatus Asgardarchaeum californiense]
MELNSLRIDKDMERANLRVLKKETDLDGEFKARNFVNTLAPIIGNYRVILTRIKSRYLDR